MHSMDRYHRATLLNAAWYHSHSTVFSTCKTRCISTIIPSGSTLFFMARSGPDTRQSLQEFMKANAKVILMLPSVGFFIRLFVFHHVRMVFVTNLAPVSVSLGGLPADAE